MSLACSPAIGAVVAINGSGSAVFNRSTPIPEHTDDGDARMMMDVYLLLTSSVSLVASSLVIAIILLKDDLRNKGNMFMVSFMSSDIAGSCLVVALVVGDLITSPNQDYTTLQRAAVCLHQITSSSSLMSSAAIAFDKYNVIVNCFRYSLLNSVSYVMRGLAIVYVPSVAINLLIVWVTPTPDGADDVPTLWLTFDVDLTRFRIYNLFLSVGLYLCPLAVISFSYWRILCIARKHLMRISDVSTSQGYESRDWERSQAADGENRRIVFLSMVGSVHKLSLFPNAVSDDRMKDVIDRVAPAEGELPNSPSHKQARVTWRLLCLVLVIVVCQTPLHAFYLGLSADLYECRAQRQLVAFVSYGFFASNRLLNPFLYAFSSRRFRNILRRLLLRHQYREERADRMRKRNLITSRLVNIYCPGAVGDNCPVRPSSPQPASHTRMDCHLANGTPGVSRAQSPANPEAGNDTSRSRTSRSDERKSLNDLDQRQNMDGICLRPLRQVKPSSNCEPEGSKSLSLCSKLESITEATPRVSVDINVRVIADSMAGQKEDNALT